MIHIVNFIFLTWQYDLNLVSDFLEGFTLYLVSIYKKYFPVLVYYNNPGVNSVWVCMQHRKKVWWRLEKSLLFNSPSSLTLVKLHFELSDLWVPHDWLWSCLSERRKVADKGTAESSRIVPTHLPGEHFFSSFSLENGNKTCIYSFAAATGCTTLANEKTIKQKTFFRAQTSYTPVWLLSLFLFYQVSTGETAGVLLNTLRLWVALTEREGVI